MPYGIGIAGCGAMGTSHANAWTQRKDSEIKAVFDPDEERCHKLADTFNATPCSTYQQMNERDDIDIVTVCTPVCFHRDIACDAMTKGKHVICEKPIALTLDEADAMIRTAEANRVKLVTSYQYRGFAKSLKYREILRGSLDRPVMFRFVDVREVRPKTAMHRTSMNGGPVIDMAGHYFDLLRFLTDDEPVSVYAQGHVFGKGKQRLAAFDDLAIDAAEISVKTTKGHCLSVYVNWGMPEQHPGFGQEYITTPDLHIYPAGKQVVVRHSDREVRYDLGPNIDGIRNADLISSIENNAKPEVSGEEGKKALAVSLAALESIEKGTLVEL